MGKSESQSLKMVTKNFEIGGNLMKLRCVIGLCTDLQFGFGYLSIPSQERHFLAQLVTWFFWMRWNAQSWAF